MEFGDVSGIIGIIFSIYGSMYGRTTVSPGLAFDTWHKDYYGYYANVQFADLRKVMRNQFTQLYFFEKKVLQPDGEYLISKEQFWMESMRRLSFACNLSTTNANGALEKTEYYRLEDFTLRVFHVAPVVKAGLFPPGAPYNVYIKVGANKLQSKCSPIAWYETEFRSMVSLPDNGSVVTRVGWVNFNYAWPPIVWAGEFYEH